MIKQIAAALTCLILCTGLAQSANVQPLTSQQVERYIASMPETMALGEKHADSQPRAIDPARPLSSSLELMNEQDPVYTDLAQLASRHGFASVKQWADVGDRTMSAYIVASSDLPASVSKTGYEIAVANINNNPDLSAAQKQAILAGMSKGHQRNLNAKRSAEQDLAAVRPHMAALNKLFD